MKRMDLPYAEVRFFDEYVIVEIKTGVNMDESEIVTMIGKLKEFYGDREFGYISNRVQDYSVNPLQSRRIITETSVAALALVSRNPLSGPVYDYERRFYRCPVEVFSEIESAVRWVRSFLNSDE